MKHKLTSSLAALSTLGAGLLAAMGTAPAQASPVGVPTSVVDPISAIHESLYGGGTAMASDLALSELTSSETQDTEQQPLANAEIRTVKKTIAQLNKWVNNHVGNCMSHNGGKPQCVDLFNAYNEQFLGNGHVNASQAKQLYDNAPASKWTKFKNGTPKKGDVAIWGGSHGGGAGHVALVLENVSSSTLRVFHQNWDISCAHKQQVSKSGIIGYLRPKNLE
ncbi:MAG: CHAP domain-containing protein [Bifidobacteriaceae bacterium]|jgi:hypothetical protein|nr:CHAP domain-containing protein [Bifidobacteriaceae bacterium]